MASIVAAIAEVRRIVLSMLLVDIYLDSLLVFMLGLLLTTIIGISWWCAALISVVYLVWHARYAFNTFSFGFVEERVPELQEMLRTAADHIHEHNQVIDELFAEVIVKLKSVRTSYFLEFGDLSKQILSVTIIAFAVIAVASFNVRFGDLKGSFSDGLFGKYKITDLDPLAKGNEKDLYGDTESLADLGNQQLSLEITPLSSQVDRDKIQDIPPAKFQNMYPDSVGAQVTDTYAEQIPRKYQSIVKTYFKTIPSS